jgi:hypothetical protein
MSTKSARSIATGIVDRSGEENLQQRQLLIDAIEQAILEARKHAESSETRRLRAVLEKIAGRKPNQDAAAAAFYRCRNDAKAALM